MGLGSFLKKYAEAKGAVSPATPHTSVSSQMVSANPVSPATLEEKKKNRELDPELRRKLLATINGEEESGPRPVIPTITKEDEETNHVTRIVNPY